MLHEVGIPTYGLDMRNASDDLAAVFAQSRLQRSVGVIYQVLLHESSIASRRVGKSALQTALDCMRLETALAVVSAVGMLPA